MFYLMKKLIFPLGGCGSSLEDTREGRLVRYAGNQRQRALSRGERCGSMSRMRAFKAAQSESAVALPLLVLRFNALGSAWV